MLWALLYLSGYVLSGLVSVSSTPQGYQLGDPTGGISVVFPLTVTQCDAVIVFYNVSISDQVPVLLYPPNDSAPFLTITPPSGAGYLVWRCTVPAGSSFIVSAVHSHTFTVQRGTSSICLGDLSADEAIARYDSVVYQSFTTRAYRLSKVPVLFMTAILDTFPTIALPSISANPKVPVSPSLFSNSVMLSFAKRTCINGANIGKIVGGVCGIVVVAVALIFAMVYARRRENVVNAGLPVHPPRVVDEE